MRKADIRVNLGLKVMNRYLGATGKETITELDKFFHGCKTNDAMLERIKLNGGWDASADAIVRGKKIVTKPAENADICDPRLSNVAP